MADHEEESLKQRRKRLRAESERKTKMGKAEKWDPAAGEVIEGEYLGRRIARDTGFGPVPVYYVETLDGEVFSLLGRTSMEQEMQQANPTSGDLVLVTYKGRVQMDGGKNDMYAYDVVSE